MKVLFLDIDGVVNKKDTFTSTDLYPLDKYMAFLVGKIQMYTDCQVVLSSSWRHHPNGVAVVEKHIVPIYDKTPSLGGTRGEEIADWLKLHPDVDKYAILDDDSDMLEEQKPNFFQTSFETGLTDDIAEKVISHLGATA